MGRLLETDWGMELQKHTVILEHVPATQLLIYEPCHCSPTLPADFYTTLHN